MPLFASVRRGGRDALLTAAHHVGRFQSVAAGEPGERLGHPLRSALEAWTRRILSEQRELAGNERLELRIALRFRHAGLLPPQHARALS